jgi:hypothetical protein
LRAISYAIRLKKATVKDEGTKILFSKVELGVAPGFFIGVPPKFFKKLFAEFDNL